MAGEQRVVPRFAAEPPQEELPYGRWEQRLREELLAAALRLDGEREDLGEPGPISWHPDRSWHGYTYVPASTLTSGGYELFGYVRFLPGDAEREPREFSAHVDFTDETAERNPDWTLDLCDEAIGSWRGEAGAVATITLVWGRPLVAGGALASAELAGLVVDQCALKDERFTLIAPDDYRHDLLEVALYDAKGRELARESLYEEDEGYEEEAEAVEEEEEEEEEEDDDDEDEDEDEAAAGATGPPEDHS
ncbi:MAG TPA: hypothetical protein VL979_11195 [Solirubrobacteraceae bacterium]|nr:hypothetical protein [Solirubrobacteraceae bacterium]